MILKTTYKEYIYTFAIAKYNGSIAIACYEYGFNLTGFELDTDYFNAGKQRVENHIQSHPKLF